MAGIEQDVSWWVREWAVISGAPVAAISYVVLVALAIWAILHFVYRERIEALKEQIQLAKAATSARPEKAAAAKRQAAVDSLSRDISQAVHFLLNRHNREPITPLFIAKWEADYHAWCESVSLKLGDREFFTESDQLLFDRLGVVPEARLSGDARYNWLTSMLSLKFDRLREIIKLIPQRPL